MPLRPNAEPLRAIEDPDEAFRQKYPVLEGDEYKKDLKRRRGGWMSTRKEDRGALDEIKAGIETGAITPDQASILIHRNPGASAELIQALQARNRGAVGIAEQFTTPADPGFQAQPQGLSYAPGDAPDPVHEFQGLGATKEFFDREGAATRADTTGQFDLANKIRGSTDSSGGSITTTLLGVRASGGTTGNQMVDSMSPQAAGRALEEVQPFVETISVNELTGEINQTLRPRRQARGANVDKGLPKRIADMTDKVDKSRLVAVAPALDILDDRLVSFRKTGELPGIGNLKNVSVSNFVKTAEGRYIQSVVNTLFVEEIRQASGTAVTEHEAQRKKIADALAAANSAADYMKVYATLIRPRWNNTIRLIKSRGGPKAVSILKQRGIDLDSMIKEMPKDTKSTREKLKESIRSKLRAQ